MMTADDLGKIVTARTVQGEVQVTGQMLTYTERPTVGIGLADGSMAHWHADMTRPATPEEIEALVIDMLTKKRTGN
jgi:hypothetical protein